MPFARAAGSCILAGAAWAATVRADVFMRLGNRPARALEQAGGRPFYQADVRVNGQPAQLALLGFDRPAGPLAPLLARRLGLPAPGSGTAALHLAGVSNGRALDLILLPGSHPDATLAMLVDRRAADTTRGREARPDWPDLPRPSGAEPLFTAVNLATRTTLAVASAPAAPAAIQADLLGRLPGEGWRPAVPPAREGGLAIYTRGNAVLLVCTQAAVDPAGPSRITMLHRSGHSP